MELRQSTLISPPIGEMTQLPGSKELLQLCSPDDSTLVPKGRGPDDVNSYYHHERTPSDGRTGSLVQG